ncbi:Arylsulfatase [Novipirellula aureliae]|uniref:Arylsulfatase n=2 Tax=Novipirellula aureliae TaxID=2527966 RepID=A0A5C6E8H4_9BACT|nr:Arylsulfatase [Novipirellula aureliae]
MNRISKIRLARGLVLLVLCLVMPATGRAATLKGTRPNIVIIMPDDISFASIGAYGNPKANSPSVDELYHKGVRFENFHVSPTCSPTRAALLTGRHECYSGVTHTIMLRDQMNPELRTMPQMLQDVGYATGIFGKWHLGDSKEYRPDSRGFGEVYIHGAGGIGQNYAHSADFPNNDYNNPVLYHNGKVIETEGYCTDLFFDQAIRWIGTQAAAKKPFFAYVPLNVAHRPHIPPILPDGSTGNIMKNLDDNVGKMMAYLDEQGLSENTLLIYMTDNGAASGSLQLKGRKTFATEGGIRVPCIMYWKGHLEGGISNNDLTGHIDYYATFAELAGSDDAVPGGQIWDGRSMLPLLENPTNAQWPQRYWIAHRTRWNDAATSQYAHASVQDLQFKLFMPNAGKLELYEVSADKRERNNVASQYPEKVEQLKKVYDAWWADVQSYMVNDHLENVPAEHKPYHELYREAFGEERYQEAMRQMNWVGGKPYGQRR